jgi:hypothetical protein
LEGDTVSEGHRGYRLSEDTRYSLRIINRLGIGSILFGWDTLLALKEFGFITKDISTLPYLLMTFGMLLVFGGTYRLRSRQKTV